MILKCEINQGVAYLLTEYGDIYRFKMAWDREPKLELVATHVDTRTLAMPSMARYMEWPES